MLTRELFLARWHPCFFIHCLILSLLPVVFLFAGTPPGNDDSSNSSSENAGPNEMQPNTRLHAILWQSCMPGF